MFLKIPMGVPAWDKKIFSCVFREIITGAIFESSYYQDALRGELCRLLNVKYCLLTDLGRIALEIGLKALGLKPKDGIILPSYVCASVLLPILKLKCEPQFADIGEDLNISPESIEKTIKSNTKAIIVPHLYGCPAPIKEILEIARERGLYVIDDAAQSLGAKVNGQYTGTFGDIGILSFGPFKVISSTRGGSLITDNYEIFERVQRIYVKKASEKAALDRFWKSLVKFRYRKYFYNFFQIYRKKKQNLEFSNKFFFQKINIFKDYPNEYVAMSNLDAFLIYLQIKKINQIINKKTLLGHRLAKHIQTEVPEVILPKWLKNGSIFLKFVIKLPFTLSCSNVIELFRKYGIEAWSGYTPLHLKYGFNNYKLPLTEKMYNKIITLPLNFEENETDIMEISSILENLKQKIKYE